MTTKEYLSNASIYEVQAIEILKQQGNIMLLCKVEYKDGDIRWTAKTYKDAMNNLTNYRSNNKGVLMMKNLKLSEVKSMPVLAQGHCENLIFDDGKTKVYHSRMTVADGMPYNNQVIIKELDNAYNWVTVKEYQAK